MEKKVLVWDKPQKAMSTEDWKKISADSAPPGVYTPNMSEEDKLKWKATLIRGKKPRVEVRKTFKGEKHYAQALFVIDPWADKSLIISTNGKIAMDEEDIRNFAEMLKEAAEVLKPLVEEIRQSFLN